MEISQDLQCYFSVSFGSLIKYDMGLPSDLLIVSVIHVLHVRSPSTEQWQSRGSETSPIIEHPVLMERVLGWGPRATLQQVTRERNQRNTPPQPPLSGRMNSVIICLIPSDTGLHPTLVNVWSRT